MSRGNGILELWNGGMYGVHQKTKSESWIHEVGSME